MPRCGSHYISSIMEASLNAISDTPVEVLGELFIPVTTYYPGIENSKIINKYINENNPVPFSDLEEKIEHCLDIISTTDKTQSVLLNVFPVNNIDIWIDRIFNTLRECNFKFVSIKRLHIEYQLLSFLIASANNKWVNLTGIEIPEKVFIENLEDATWLFNNILRQDSILKKHNIICPTIYYENAIDDMSRLFAFPIIDSSQYFIQRIENPYDMILNSEEVKSYIHKLMRK
jgi:hypothetical protein